MTGPSARLAAAPSVASLPQGDSPNVESHP